jgi:DNA-binding SARP family transcriptional activator/TolB-like protein
VVSAESQRPAALRLTTLGGLAVSDGAGTPLPAAPPRRRLALLAVVAASGERGVAREKLLAWFWPDGDEDRARHALTQTLYALRRDLGRELLAGTSTLRVLPTAVRADVAELEEALDRGDPAAAVALYGGPFLDGVHLPGLPELERWIEEERSRLAHRVARALESLADAAERRGDAAGAERWWRALATLDPLSARYALGLMRALAAIGERAAAVRHARVHAALVREALDVDPDPAVGALAERLAETPAESPPPAAAATTPRAPSDAAAEPAPTPVPAGAPPVPWYRRPRALAAVAGGAAAVAALLVAARRAAPGGGGAVARGSEWVVVADFENATGDTLLDRSLTLAFADGLEQSERVSLFSRARVRDVLALMGRGGTGADTLVDESVAREVAERAGVRLLVIPSVSRVDTTYIISARVVDAVTGESVASEETRAAGRACVLAALDDLTRRVRRRFGEPALALRPATPLPPATTRSLEALRLFADASRAFNASDYGVAEGLYKAALARDSTFALAHASLGRLYAWVNRNPEAEPHFERALALADSLPEREGALVRARVAGWRGDWERQIDLLRGLLLRHPNDAAARSELAYAYLRHGQPAEARALYTAILAADSTNANAWINLATAASGLHDYPGALAAYRRAFALDSSLETTQNLNNEYGGALVRAGRPDEARATFAKMLAKDPFSRMRGHRSLAYLALHRGRFAGAAEELAEACMEHMICSEIN